MFTKLVTTVETSALVIKVPEAFDNKVDTANTAVDEDAKKRPPLLLVLKIEYWVLGPIALPQLG